MAGNASRDIVLKSIPNRNMLTMGKSPAVNFAFPIQMYSIQMYLAPRVAIVMAKERVLGWEKGRHGPWCRTTFTFTALEHSAGPCC
jgi:hypothetical protein